MALESLSATILALHENADVAALRGYRSWALAQLCERIACSRAVWGAGSVETDVLHELQLHPAKRTPAVSGGARALAETEAAASLRDPLSDRLSDWLGDWLGDANLVSRFGRANQSPRIVAGEARPGLQFAARDPVSGLIAFIVLERAAGEKAFPEADRALFGALAPHLLAAWRRCQKVHLYARSLADGGLVAALIDRHGCLRMADGRFYSLLRRTWPQWGGARLPEALLQLADQQGETVIGATRWSSAEIDGFIYVSGQSLGAMALLKPQEQSIAAAIVAGNSYRQAAESHGVTANVVRNTLTRVYQRLGVNNRQQLCHRLQLGAVGLPPSTRNSSPLDG
jgi:DNA-binding CsgD family transcriptional regulator